MIKIYNNIKIIEIKENGQILPQRISINRSKMGKFGEILPLKMGRQ